VTKVDEYVRALEISQDVKHVIRLPNFRSAEVYVVVEFTGE